MNISILCEHFQSVNRGAEVFALELSRRLSGDIGVLKNSSNLKKGTQIVISTNGRADVFKAKAWCLLNNCKLIVSGQSGLGLDDRLNLYSFPDVFVCLTTCQSNWAKTINPFVKTEVIPNGVNTSHFLPSHTPPQTDVLCVSALESSKRIELLIEALRDTNLSLRLVGKGSQYEKINYLGNKLLPGRFEIISVSHSNMPDIYSSAKVFVYPTVPWESFGISILEALSCNLPVVATNDPIRKEIIGNAGLFVDPTNTASLRSAIFKALETNWSDIPRIRAKHFEWDNIATQYDLLIKKLCSQ